MITDYILGVDGGGTKTIALLCYENGKVIARGEAEGSGYKSVGINNSKTSLAKALKEALNPLLNEKRDIFLTACFGMADNDTSKDWKMYQEIVRKSEYGYFFPESQLQIVNDTQIALAAGTEKDYGIVLVAGTGSNCFGINQKGEEIRCGGMDWLLSDEGSAYEMGIKALKAVLWEYDGRGPKTALSNLLLNQLNKKLVTDIFDWAYAGRFTKAKFAALAPCVNKAYDMDDKVAISIIQKSIDGLALLAKTVIERLEMEQVEFEFILSGGVFNIGDQFIKLITDRIIDCAPQAIVKKLQKEPVYGAITIAQRRNV